MLIQFSQLKFVTFGVLKRIIAYLFTLDKVNVY